MADQVTATDANAVDPDDAALDFSGFADGPVTFTRPGIEGDDGSVTVNVKDGKVSTTKAKRDWLLRYVVGGSPAG